MKMVYMRLLSWIGMFGYVWLCLVVLVCSVLHGCRTVSIRMGKENEKNIFFLVIILFIIIIITILLCSIQNNLQSTSQGHWPSPFTWWLIILSHGGLPNPGPGLRSLRNMLVVTHGLFPLRLKGFDWSQDCEPRFLKLLINNVRWSEIVGVLSTFVCFAWCTS